MTFQLEGSALQRLAQANGVLTEFLDVRGRRQRASPEALLHILSALGVDARSPDDAAGPLEEAAHGTGRRLSDPVAVAWSGAGEFLVRSPEPDDRAPLDCSLRLEDGTVSSWRVDVSTLPVRDVIEAGKTRYMVRAAPLPGGLPPGYHELFLEQSGSLPVKALVVSAPDAAFSHDGEGRRWGVFLPLYALWGRHGQAIGDLGDLGRLSQWAGGLGASFAATLPLLAAYLDEPLEVSPYAPVSRLFWNELFLDVHRLAGSAACPGWHQELASPDWARVSAELAAAPLVDYRTSMALKRRVIEALAGCAGGSLDEEAGLRHFLEAHPHAAEYAAFRAAVEAHGANWRAWPEAMRAGRIVQEDYAPAAYRYHATAQRLITLQMAEAAELSRRPSGGLYLDLPVGIHPDGFDTWRFRGDFAESVSAGAPPDDFFTQGQDWGFPPLHPAHVREHGYQYFIEYIRHHMRSAALLRIDHVMTFHRMFWVPQGAKATDGAYVGSHPDEYWAILCLESQRHRTEIIGENLGTVPPGVNANLARHAAKGMYVGQFQARPGTKELLRTPPRNAVASLNTHDAPPFAAFWRGLDLDLRVSLGLLTAAGLKDEQERREQTKMAVLAALRRDGYLPGDYPDEEDVLKAWEAFLAASPAAIMILNLEDVWLEAQPQNVPGTGPELPNWRRKARMPFEAFATLPEVVEVMRTIDALRRGEARPA